jgi:hypothetical protein
VYGGGEAWGADGVGCVDPPNDAELLTGAAPYPLDDARLQVARERAVSG